VRAAIRIFEASGAPRDFGRYVDAYRLFKRAICQAELGKGVARALMAAKGMDVGDTVLAKAIGGRLIHSLRMQEKRGRGRETASGTG
jgi:hypothetical protein